MNYRQHWRKIQYFSLYSCNHFEMTMQIEICFAQIQLGASCNSTWSINDSIFDHYFLLIPNFIAQPTYWYLSRIAKNFCNMRKKCKNDDFNINLLFEGNTYWWKIVAELHLDKYWFYDSLSLLLTHIKLHFFLNKLTVIFTCKNLIYFVLFATFK